MKKTTVVIVEDDEKFLDSLTKVIEGRGFTVMGFTEAGPAFEFIRRKKKSVILITDVNLNGDSGLDLLAQVGRRRPDVPVIVITGYASTESAIRALKLGAYDYITKPCEPEEVIHSLRRAFEKVRAERQRRESERRMKKILRELEEKNREVERLSSFKSFMISTASHDLKTLLTVLSGYHSMLSENCAEKLSPDEATLVREGGRCLKRALMMVESLLDYHAVEEGRIKLSRTRFPIADLIRECLDFIEPYARLKDLNIVHSGESEDVIVFADRLKVAQIFDNLVINAIKFSPAGTEIRVETSLAGDRVLVSVSDQGPGIPQEKIKEIFDGSPLIFKREDVGTVGLGLSICRKLVQVQGGEMRIESSPGKGTTVTFTLPVEEEK